MDTIVGNFLPVNAVLLLQVRVKARFNILNNGFPAETRLVEELCAHKRLLPIFVVDEVTESWCVNNCKAKTDTILFDVCEVALLSNHPYFQ